MAVLVVADHDNSNLRDSTHKTVTAAQAIGGDVDILVAGTNTAAVAAQAAKIAGVRKVLTAESAELGQGLAEAMADLVVGLAGGYDQTPVPTKTEVGSPGRSWNRANMIVRMHHTTKTSCSSRRTRYRRNPATA